MFTDSREYIPAPGMIMALGIYVQSAGPHFLTLLGVDEPTRYLRPAVYGLLLLAVVIFATLAIRFAQDPSTFLQPIADNFSIGTWAAAANVLAVALAELADQMTLARAFNILGWLCWIYYMVWFIRAARRREVATGITGRGFLTTVSTQSVVVSSLSVWPWGHQALLLFLGLNLLGLAFYGYIFFHVWIVRGVRTQLAEWAAPHNITHGALSITVLAQESLYLGAARRFSFLAWGMSAIWAVAALGLLVVFAVELVFLFSAERHRVLGYRMVNFARNFTYGMFFACTHLGAKQIPTSLMARLVTPAALLGLAVLATGINLWEISNQILHYAVRVGG